jgi:hypothetical protein
MKHGAQLKVKIHILFCGDNSWTTALVKNEVWYNDRSCTSVIVIIIFFGEAFKYGYDAKFWGFVGTNAEPLCAVILYNVNYLTYY